jgi:proteic killer suppression protein
MIRSLRGDDAEDIWLRRKSRRFGPTARIILRKLLTIDAATSLADLMSPSGNRLEALRGERIGQHSIRINDQFRICFIWREGHAYEVEITDYH